MLNDMPLEGINFGCLPDAGEQSAAGWHIRLFLREHLRFAKRAEVPMTLLSGEQCANQGDLLRVAIARGPVRGRRCVPARAGILQWLTKLITKYSSPQQPAPSLEAFQRRSIFRGMDIALPGPV